MKKAQLLGTRTAVVLLACAGLVALPAAADVVRLADDPAALSAWQGTSPSDYSYGGVRLRVDLDYAVYAPGSYGGEDPSGGSEYVYAYQVLNRVESTVAVSVLSIGLEDPALANNIDDDISSGAPGFPGGIGPDMCVVGGSSARWAFGWFGGSEIGPEEDSSVLIFTSPQGPRWNSSTVVDGGLPVPAGNLPSPVPEPATLSLLALGAVGALIRRRRRC